MSPHDGVLRCAQLIETLDTGGAEQLAVRVAGGLARRGHASHLVVMTAPGPLSDRVSGDVNVHYLGFERASVRRPLAFLGSFVSGYRKLTRLLDEHGIEVVQTHLPGANFWGLPLAWRGVAGVVPTVHNNEEFRYGDHDLPLLAVLRRTAYRLMLRHCGGMIAVSADVRDSLVEQLGESERHAARITVIPNAVPFPEAQGPGVREEIRRRYGAAGDDVLLLAAGRFGPQKNFGDLVEAAALLKDLGTGFRLVIAGDGAERPRLAERVEAEGLAGHVLLPGNLDDLDRVMAAADLFVMSSLWEGLPLVLLEAMAAGLPVVAYGIPGVAEVVMDGETGELVEKGSVPALTDALQRLAADGGMRRYMGRAAVAAILADHDFGALLDRLESCYLSSLE